MRDTRLAGEIYNLFAKHMDGAIDRDGVRATLRAWNSHRKLNSDVLNDVDAMLERVEISQAEYAMRYRMLHVDAAEIMGDPRVIGNAAAAASLVAVHLEKDYVSAAELQVRAIECFIVARNSATVSSNFRNVALLYQRGARISPRTFVPLFERLVAVLLKMNASGWKPNILAECVEPVIECLKYLVPVAGNADFTPSVRDLSDRIIPKLPFTMMPKLQQELAVALGYASA